MHLYVCVSLYLYSYFKIRDCGVGIVQKTDKCGQVKTSKLYWTDIH